MENNIIAEVKKCTFMADALERALTAIEDDFNVIPYSVNQYIDSSNMVASEGFQAIVALLDDDSFELELFEYEDSKGLPVVITPYERPAEVSFISRRWAIQTTKGKLILPYVVAKSCTTITPGRTYGIKNTKHICVVKNIIDVNNSVRVEITNENVPFKTRIVRVTDLVETT